MMQRRIASSFAAAATALLLAACGGGGGGSHVPATSPAVTSTPAPAAQTAQVSFTINTSTIATASATRSPKFVSPSTQSATVSLQGQNTPLNTVNFTPGSTNCTTTANGLQCTITANAPVGQDTFVVSTFDGLNGTGNVLSNATVVKTIALNTVNSVNLVLNGVVARVQVILGSSSVQAGTPATIPVTVVAFDGATPANIIVGPGNYSTPVTLANTDTSGVTSLSATQVAGPGTAVTLHYNGGSSAGTTITPSAGTAISVSATFAAAGYAFIDFTAGAINQFIDVATTGPDGNVWFTSSGQIGFITPAGVSTIYSVLPFDIFGLATASNGVIWFGDGNQDIGSIATADGTVTLLNSVNQPDGCSNQSLSIARRKAQGAPPIGPACGEINWMVLGPDQNVWFSDDNGYIGNITPAGVATEWDVTLLPGWNGTFSEPTQITFGADGALYAADEFGLLDRITVAGGSPTGATFIAGPGCSDTFALAIDAANTIWTQDECSNIYALPLGNPISPGNFNAAALQSYSIDALSNGKSLGYLISAPGGVFGLDLDGNLVYRINSVTGSNPPQAAISSFTQFPGSDQSDALTIGGDGNLWALFNESNLTTADIAKVVYGAPPTGAQSLVRGLSRSTQRSRNAAALSRRHHRRAH